MNNMPAEGENGIENELFLEALRHYTPAEVAGVLELFLLNQSNLLEFWSQACNLTLSSSDASFFKSCSRADVDGRQQRFLIPVDDAVDHIIPMLSGEEGAREGIPIRVYLNDGKYYPLLFKQRCDNKYVITHRGPPEIRQWRHVCYAMGLQEGDGVRMWVCRHVRNRELCICTAKEVRER